MIGDIIISVSPVGGVSVSVDGVGVSVGGVSTPLTVTVVVVVGGGGDDRGAPSCITDVGIFLLSFSFSLTAVPASLSVTSSVVFKSDGIGEDRLLFCS